MPIGVIEVKQPTVNEIALKLHTMEIALKVEIHNLRASLHNLRDAVVGLCLEQLTMRVENLEAEVKAIKGTIRP